MPSKQELHDQLSALLTDAGKYGVSMVGHCLIELGLLTSIECGYADCIKDDRKFVHDPTNRNGGPKWVTIDHVIARCDGGLDMPDNLMLLHNGCNASKGAKEYHANPERKKAFGNISRERWKDPEYRRKNAEAQSKAQRRPKTAALKKQRMKDHWSDPEKKKKHSEAIKHSWNDEERRAKASERLKGRKIATYEVNNGSCSSCGRHFKSGRSFNGHRRHGCDKSTFIKDTKKDRHENDNYLS